MNPFTKYHFVYFFGGNPAGISQGFLLVLLTTLTMLYKQCVFWAYSSCVTDLVHFDQYLCNHQLHHLHKIFGDRNVLSRCVRSWGHVVFLILGLAYFSQYNVLWVYKCCFVFQKCEFLLLLWLSDAPRVHSTFPQALARWRCLTWFYILVIDTVADFMFLRYV